jgi:hypothetical protein
MKSQSLCQALLWAAAILAAALVGAPPLLSGLLLPVLAAVAMLTAPHPVPRRGQP